MSSGGDYNPIEPAGVELVESENRLYITWSDGRVTQYPVDWLRWQCPCAHCRGEMGVPGRLDFVKELSPQETTMQSAEPIGRYAIMFFWADGHHDGIYTYDWLRRNSQDEQSAAPDEGTSK
jgi:DUF971 family protein